MDGTDTTSDIAIIGSGFSGLGMAIRLKQQGRNDFIVFESAHSVGGTWRDNHYPGLACDVPSHLYSFSFAPNPMWSRSFSPGPEIRRYLEDCAERFGILPHIRFGAHVVHASWQEAERRWMLEMASGDKHFARILVAGLGGLSRPAVPSIPGIAAFAGETFHSAQWNQAYDLRGKRVAVIGTGASAIQFVPQIVPLVGSLQLFQRTPPWVMPKPDRELTAAEHWLFRRFPAAQRLARAGVYCVLESRVPGFTLWPGAMKLAQNLAIRHIHQQVADRRLRAILTPKYTMGCKRVLMSNDYYPSLTRANVQVITEGIQEVRANGIVTKDGVLHEIDCLILGTGFHATDPLPPGVIFGRGGVDILTAWGATPGGGGPEAYLGTTVAGFPNLFLLMGPNTGLGHSSMVYMIESQIQYVLDAVRIMEQKQIQAVDVLSGVQAAFNHWLRERLRGTVWQSGGCQSWYRNAAGKNVVLWPGFTWQFRKRTKHFDVQNYQQL
jgi:cation diffusion facilitator CzcD-associated flavoprotein CzcO